MIDFPNHSRSYDRTRRAVRFWGHDSAIEASFFIDEGALKHIQPGAHSNESGFLNAFDSHRDLICAAAARKYVRGSRGSYNLVAGDF
jgi:membrane glycosyltransferase